MVPDGCTVCQQHPSNSFVPDVEFLLRTRPKHAAKDLRESGRTGDMSREETEKCCAMGIFLWPVVGPHIPFAAPPPCEVRLQRGEMQESSDMGNNMCCVAPL